MADLDKFLATFRINQEEWKDFMALAKAQGKSAEMKVTFVFVVFGIDIMKVPLLLTIQ